MARDTSAKFSQKNNICLISAFTGETDAMKKMTNKIDYYLIMALLFSNSNTYLNPPYQVVLGSFTFISCT